MSQTKETKPAVIEGTITDQVLSKVKTLTEAKLLRLPKDYSVENALKGAYIILQDVKDKDGNQALKICSKESIALALLKMVTEGLSPLKKQGSFIVRATMLNWEREYDGDVALAKRAGLKWIRARCVYEGDEYLTEIDQNGIKKLVKHEQIMSDIDDNKIKGAYAIFEVEGEGIQLVEMPMTKIRVAWNQGAMKGNSPAHKNFTSEMAERTVTRKACKPIIRRADDAPLFSDDEPEDTHFTQANEEVKNKANKELMNFTDVEEVRENEKKETVEKKASSKVEKKPEEEQVQGQEQVDAVVNQGPGF